MVITRFVVDLSEATEEDMGDFIGALAAGLLEGDHVLLDGATYLALNRVLIPFPG